MPTPAELDCDALGAYLRELREARGWSQETAARRCGLGYGNLSTLEQGGGVPRVGTLLKLSRGYSVPMLELLGRLVPGADWSVPEDWPRDTSSGGTKG